MTRASRRSRSAFNDLGATGTARCEGSQRSQTAELKKPAPRDATSAIGHVDSFPSMRCCLDQSMRAASPVTSANRSS
jgi:hypothetical protein